MSVFFFFSKIENRNMLSFLRFVQHRRNLKLTIIEHFAIRIDIAKKVWSTGAPICDVAQQRIAVAIWRATLERNPHVLPDTAATRIGIWIRIVARVVAIVRGGIARQLAGDCSSTISAIFFDFLGSIGRLEINLNRLNRNRLKLNNKNKI